MAIAGAVVALVQIVKASGVPTKWGLLLCIIFSGVAMAVWGYSHADFTRATSWDYFVGFGSVLTSASGVFGIINKTPESITSMKGFGTNLVNSIKGTGPGGN
jgi:hypothetical protein